MGGRIVVIAIASLLITSTPMSASTQSKDDGPIDGRAHRLFVRSASGITIRVHQMAVGAGSDGGAYPSFGPGIVSAGTVSGGTVYGGTACQATATLLVGLSTDEAVGQGGGGLLPTRKKPVLIYIASGAFGVVEGSPSAWVAVQTAPDVARVRVEFADGASDAMAPRKGVAVLASKVKAQLAQIGERSGSPLGTVEALDAHGHVLGRIKLGPTLSYRTGIPRDCQPPTLESAFPEPKGPPPTDEAAARYAIVTAYTTAYNPGHTRDEKLAALEDGATLAATFDAAVAGSPQFANRVSIQVDEIQFVDARTAAVRFNLIAAGSTVIQGQIGRAKLVDGRWVVARRTFCTLVSFGGFQCPKRDRGKGS